MPFTGDFKLYETGVVCDRPTDNEERQDRLEDRTRRAVVLGNAIAVNGHVYVTGRSGTTVVIKDSDQLNIVASNSVGETVDATPAPVDNELFIRGENHLFCISQ